MVMASRIKEDERHEKIIRGLLKLPANKRCINCNNLVSMLLNVDRFVGHGASGQVGAVFSLLGFIRHNALLPRMTHTWHIGKKLQN